MKKSVLAIAILGTFAGAASAQSTVTLQGTIDVNARYVKNEGSDRRVSMGTDGINASQLVFSGTEDLGGGLTASFQLNSGISVDTGNSTGDAPTSKFFNRRSTVSLAGGFGEIRLGRDYTPTYWNNALFDAFGNLGVANSINVRQTSSSTFVRADNAISYFLPSKIGGVYGQVMVAASEGAATNNGRYIGGRVGFAAGPFDVSAAAAEQRLDALNGKHKTYNVGASYDFGVVKVLGYYDRDTLDTFNQPSATATATAIAALAAMGSNQRDSRGGVSVVVPMGQGEIHAGYSRSKFTSSTVAGNTVSQYGLGYVYSLSKRTAVYTNVARLSNGNGSNNSVNSLTSGSASPLSPNGGGKSTGFEFGVRHFF